jgi:hypothetical protein
MKGSKQISADNFNIVKKDSEKYPNSELPSEIRGQSFRFLRTMNEISAEKLLNDTPIEQRFINSVVHSPNPDRIMSKSMLFRLERQNSIIPSVLISQLSDLLGRNLFDDDIFIKELKRSLVRYIESNVSFKKEPAKQYIKMIKTPPQKAFKK